MAATTHRTQPLVLLCIITVITYTDLINCKPIERSATDCQGTDCYVDLDSNSHNTQLLENITGAVVPTLPLVIDLLQNIAYTQTNATTTASTAFNALPAIVDLLKKDVNLQSFQNHFLVNSSSTVTQHLVELVSLMQNQQNTEHRHNYRLEKITLPEITGLLQNIALTQQNVLPAILDLLEEEKNLHVSQNNLMANNSAVVAPNLVELVSLIWNQESTQEKQNRLLEDTSASLQQMTALLQDFPPILANIVQVQQDMHQQLISMTHLLQPRNDTSLPRNTPLQPCDTTTLPSNCSGALSTGQQKISPINDELGSFNVYCDMDTDGGGWIVFQRRFNGSVDFDRNWVDYERGFGSLDGEFWLGLDKLHVLTSRSRYELLVQLEDYNGNSAYAQYDEFYVGDSSSLYRLHLGSYSGTAGDAMSYQKAMAFTTKDQDHDELHYGNCAIDFRSGWWFRGCTFSNLNGLYFESDEYETPRMFWFSNNTKAQRMFWYQWKTSGEVQILKKTELKIRPVEE